MHFFRRLLAALCIIGCTGQTVFPFIYKADKLKRLIVRYLPDGQKVFGWKKVCLLTKMHMPGVDKKTFKKIAPYLMLQAKDLSDFLKTNPNDRCLVEDMFQSYAPLTEEGAQAIGSMAEQSPDIFTVLQEGAQIENIDPRFASMSMGLEYDKQALNQLLVGQLFEERGIRDALKQEYSKIGLSEAAFYEDVHHLIKDYNALSHKYPFEATRSDEQKEYEAVLYDHKAVPMNTVLKIAQQDRNHVVCAKAPHINHTINLLNKRFGFLVDSLEPEEVQLVVNRKVCAYETGNGRFIAIDLKKVLEE